MKRSIPMLLALMLGACQPALAQAPAGEYLNLSTYRAGDDNKTLAQLGYTTTSARDSFPSWYAQWTKDGRTAAAFIQNTLFTAKSNDASFLWGACNIYTGGMKGCVACNGTPFSVTSSLRLPTGKYIGAGTFMGARFSTMLKPDHLHWQGDPKRHDVLVSWSFNNSSILGYHESSFVSDIRIDGAREDKFALTKYSASGIVLFNPGEATCGFMLKSDFNNDYGLLVVGGAPLDIHHLSGFCNGRAAAGIFGCGIGLCSIDVISGDDNPWLLEMGGGWEREPGGCDKIGVMKCESATIPLGTLGPMQRYVGEGALCLRGQFNVAVGQLNYHSGFGTTGQLIWVNNLISNGTPQASRVEVSGKGAGYAVLLVDSVRHTYYDAPPPEQAWHMVYTTVDGKLVLNDVVQTPKPYPVGMGPLGFANIGELMDPAHGIPQMQITGAAPPPVCAWVQSPETCTTCSAAGTQTCTIKYVKSPAGCTTTVPKPADIVRTVTCQAPPTDVAIAPIVAPYNGTPGNITTVNWVGVRSITLTNMAVPAGTLASQRLFGAATGFQGVWTDAQGRFWVNTSGSDVLVPSSALLEAGKTKTITLTFTTPQSFQVIGATIFNGQNSANGWVGTIAEIRAKQ